MSGVISYIKNYSEYQPFLAVMLDLDHLKQINDTFGHDEGDQAIRTAAEVGDKGIKIWEQTSGGASVFCSSAVDKNRLTCILAYRTAIDGIIP